MNVNVWEFDIIWCENMMCKWAKHSLSLYIIMIFIDIPIRKNHTFCHLYFGLLQSLSFWSRSEEPDVGQKAKHRGCRRTTCCPLAGAGTRRLRKPVSSCPREHVTQRETSAIVRFLHATNTNRGEPTLIHELWVYEPTRSWCAKPVFFTLDHLL